MAKIKKHVAAKISIVAPKARKRLTAMPVLNAVKKEIHRDVRNLLDKKSTQETITQLKKRSIEDVMLGVARKASGTIDSAIKEEQRVAKREARQNKQYQVRLMERFKETKARKVKRSKKDEFIVCGRVLHPETGEPVPGMVVEAIDKDIFKHDLLGVDVTDSRGRFEIVFNEKDFKERGEKLPEVFMRVSTDRKKELHVTKEIIKPRPGERADVDITLPESKVQVIKKIMTGREAIDKRRLYQVGQTMTYANVEHMALQEVGKVLKEGLNKAVAFLETRIEDAENKKVKTTNKTKTKAKPKTKNKKNLV